MFSKDDGSLLSRSLCFDSVFVYILGLSVRHPTRSPWGRTSKHDDEAQKPEGRPFLVLLFRVRHVFSYFSCSHPRPALAALSRLDTLAVPTNFSRDLGNVEPSEVRTETRRREVTQSQRRETEFRSASRGAAHRHVIETWSSPRCNPKLGVET
jgi:hypothetical protein